MGRIINGLEESHRKTRPTQAAGRYPAPTARVSSETESQAASAPARIAVEPRPEPDSDSEPVAARGLPGPAVLRLRAVVEAQAAAGQQPLPTVCCNRD